MRETVWLVDSIPISANVSAIEVQLEPGVLGRHLRIRQTAKTVESYTGTEATPVESCGRWWARIALPCRGTPRPRWRGDHRGGWLCGTVALLSIQHRKQVFRSVNMDSIGSRIGRNNILGIIGNEVLGMKGNIGTPCKDTLNELTIAIADISRFC